MTPSILIPYSCLTSLQTMSESFILFRNSKLSILSEAYLITLPGDVPVIVS